MGNTHGLRKLLNCERGQRESQDSHMQVEVTRFDVYTITVTILY